VKESVILKIAFIISILGIVLLYLFADALIIPETTLNETEDKDGKTIKVIGIIKNINIKNSTDDEVNKTFTILTIEQVNTVAAYIGEEINVTKGAKIEITGKIEEGMMFAEEIKLVNYTS